MGLIEANITLNHQVEHPGKIIEKELKKRGISQKEFAYMVNRPQKTISDIICGKKGISPQTACDMELLTGTNALYFLQKQAAYDLAIQRRVYKNTLRELPPKKKVDKIPCKTEMFKEDILYMHENGFSCADIAKHTKLCQSSIYQVLRKAKKVTKNA